MISEDLNYANKNKRQEFVNIAFYVLPKLSKRDLKWSLHNWMKIFCVIISWEFLRILFLSISRYWKGVERELFVYVYMWRSKNTGLEKSFVLFVRISF